MPLCVWWKHRKVIRQHLRKISCAFTYRSDIKIFWPLIIRKIILSLPPVDRGWHKTASVRGSITHHPPLCRPFLTGIPELGDTGCWGFNLQSEYAH
jgi:hypothetical protein